jgi:hypothetical protein
VGIGLGLGDGDGDGEAGGEGEAAGEGEADASGDGEEAATTSRQTGRNARARGKRMKSGNDSRRILVTQAATESTSPR